jgi:hypothetical protein
VAFARARVSYLVIPTCSRGESWRQFDHSGFTHCNQPIERRYSKPPVSRHLSRLQVYEPVTSPRLSKLRDPQRGLFATLLLLTRCRACTVVCRGLAEAGSGWMISRAPVRPQTFYRVLTFVSAQDTVRAWSHRPSLTLSPTR